MEFLYKEDLSSFVIRLWKDEDHGHWRGHITHIQSRQGIYFLKFEQMEDFISRFFSVDHVFKSSPVFSNMDQP